MMFASLRPLAALLLALIALAGCSPVYETRHSYYPPASPEGRRCADACKDVDRYCSRNCRLEEEHCRHEARLRAERDFNRYVAERRAHGQPVKKSMSDFEYAGHCGSSACEEECGREYHGCFRDCGGEIRSREVCTMFCD